MCGMAGKLEAIRYSLRRYERIVNRKLSEDKVCGADNLYNRTEVRDFMEQYKEDGVDDSLLDLFGVEFGEILEASSLLKAMMRSYCTTDPGKAQRFVEGIINYALAGSLSHFAYTRVSGVTRKHGKTAVKTKTKEKSGMLSYTNSLQFHFTLCRYFLGHVSCRNLPWQDLGRGTNPLPF